MSLRHHLDWCGDLPQINAIEFLGKQAGSASAIAASPRTPMATSLKQVAELKGSDTVARDQFGASSCLDPTDLLSASVGYLALPSAASSRFWSAVAA